VKIRRKLATAVAVAVATPALLLSVTPAFAADPVPGGQVQDEKPKPTPAELEKLKKAAADAKIAYDDAVTKAAEAKKYADDYLKDDSPARKHVAELRKKAADAGTALTEATDALTKAKETLDKLPAGTPEAEVTAAKEAVKKAQETHDTAVTTKSDADKTVSLEEGNIYKGYMDAQSRAGTAATAEATAKKTYDDAVKAYEAAKAEAGKPDPTKPPVDPTKPPVDPTKPPVDPTDPDPTKPKPPFDPDKCVKDAALATTLNGLPSKIVAGTTVEFTLHVANGTKKDFKEIKPFAVVYGHDKNDFTSIDNLLQLQSAAAGSNDWKDVGEAQYAGTIINLEAGKSADLKLRLKVDKKAPASEGLAFVSGDSIADPENCIQNPLKEYPFSVLPAGSKIDDVDDSKPKDVKDTDSVKTPQGNSSVVPVTTDAGNLAATGSSGTPQIALAAGAAVVLGAGAVFVVRRRKPGQQA
jgi:colicin import membrane protein